MRKPTLMLDCILLWLKHLMSRSSKISKHNYSQNKSTLFHSGGVIIFALFCTLFAIFGLDSMWTFLKKKLSSNVVQPQNQQSREEEQQQPLNNVDRNDNLLSPKTEVVCAILFVVVNSPLVIYRVLSKDMDFVNDNPGWMDFLFYTKHLAPAIFVSFGVPTIIAMRNQHFRAFLKSFWLPKITIFFC